MRRLPPPPTLFPYTTLFRSRRRDRAVRHPRHARARRGDLHRQRSEEHTSELQSHHDLVCRLLRENKKDVTKYRGRKAAAREAVQRESDAWTRCSGASVAWTD